MVISLKTCGSLLELSKVYNDHPDAKLARSLIRISSHTAECKIGPELAQAYAVPCSTNNINRQQVVSTTNLLTLEQAWFNPARRLKPQTFASDPSSLDPTRATGECDFCKWRTRTAEDTFGRIEMKHAVTGSNMFKYCAPSHGIVLFKHHDPLSFDLAQLTDLLTVSWLWLKTSHRLHPHAQCPFFIWNCLPRAGASQYHGHAQVMLSSVPFPAQQVLHNVAERHRATLGRNFYEDMLRTHDSVGLLRTCGSSKDRAWCYASLVPIKDMELVVMGSHMASPPFIALLHAALRTLIDRLGCKTFNVGILNIPLTEAQHDQACSGDEAPFTIGLPLQHVPSQVMVARVAARGKIESRASDFGGLEVFGSASIGHTDPYDVISALQDELSSKSDVFISL